MNAKEMLEHFVDKHTTTHNSWGDHPSANDILEFRVEDYDAHMKELVEIIEKLIVEKGD